MTKTPLVPSEHYQFFVCLFHSSQPVSRFFGGIVSTAQATITLFRLSFLFCEDYFHPL